MKKIIFTLMFCISFLISGEIEVDNAFVKIVPQSMKQTAVFMDIKNSSDKEVKLIKASTSLSDVTELHTHLNENGMMKMVQVKDIVVPAKGEVNLKPGGLHVMVFELKNEVNENTFADVTLEFDNGEVVKLEKVPAKIVKKMHKHGHDHEHEHKHEEGHK